MSEYPQLDMDYVRSQFPGLHNGWTLFDNAGGSQIVRPAVERITEFLYHKNVQIGGSYPASVAAAEALLEARQAMQTWVNARLPEEIVFGPTTTALLQNLARAMRRQLQAGDEIIVTDFDHESNIGCWEQLAEFGVVIRSWPLDRQTQSLRLADLDALLSSRTRLVCVTHVSNILGTIHPVADIAERVHAAGARLCVDAVAYAPHRSIDVQAWDVDYYLFSLYKAYGPHQAVMYGKHDHLLELDTLYHYFYGKDKVPAKLEPGNANYELANSAVGIVAYLASLGAVAGEHATRRERIACGFDAIRRQEDALVDRLLDWLDARADIHIVGTARNTDSMRVPTVAFRIEGRSAADMARAMERYRIAIRFGDFHSRRLIEALALQDHDGVVRVSMVHYNTLAEVDALTAALCEVLSREVA